LARSLTAGRGTLGRCLDRYDLVFLKLFATVEFDWTNERDAYAVTGKQKNDSYS
jgi:hypothetical protein